MNTVTGVVAGLVLQVPDSATAAGDYGEEETSLLTSSYGLNSMIGGSSRHAAHQPLTRQISPSLSCLPCPTPADVHRSVDHVEFPHFARFAAHF